MACPLSATPALRHYLETLAEKLGFFAFKVSLIQERIHVRELHGVKCFARLSLYVFTNACLVAA